MKSKAIEITNLPFKCCFRSTHNGFGLNDSGGFQTIQQFSIAIRSDALIYHRKYVLADVMPVFVFEKSVN